MQSTLYEQLAAAQAIVKAHGDTQEKLSAALARSGAETRRLEALKKVAVDAAEHAAKIGALFHMGEATDKDVKAANEAAHDAMVTAGGADHAIKRLNREAELISERYHASHPAAVAAQEVCNQLRAHILLESTNEAAVKYRAAVTATHGALVHLLGHEEALKRTGTGSSFTPRYPHGLEVPAFPSLPAFAGNLGWSLVMPVGSLAAAADAVMRSLGTNGKPL